MLPTNRVIVRNPEILEGTAVFRRTRVPFQTLLDYLEGGDTFDEFLEDFPTVTPEAAISALELAKSLVVGQREEARKFSEGSLSARQDRRDWQQRNGTVA